MAVSKQTFGTYQTLDVTSAATLANATSANSAAVNNSTTGYFDILFAVSITSGAAAIANSVCEVWVKGSLDGTNYEDDGNDHLVGQMTLSAAGAQVERTIVSAASGFSGPMPPYVMLRIRNATGAAFTAASAGYVGVLTSST